MPHLAAMSNRRGGRVASAYLPQYLFAVLGRKGSIYTTSPNGLDGRGRVLGWRRCDAVAMGALRVVSCLNFHHMPEWQPEGRLEASPTRAARPTVRSKARNFRRNVGSEICLFPVHIPGATRRRVPVRGSRFRTTLTIPSRFRLARFL
ncbi:hypothetical protein [Azospirillum endophyticum]